MDNTQREENYNKILNYAFKLLGQRRYTERKLTQKLKTRFINNSDIPKVISRLNELKYLDDFDYSLAYIRSIINTKPCGRYLIEQKLKIQGVSIETIQKAIEESCINEQEMAKTVLQKKIKSFSRFPGEKIMQKAQFYLKSRGFQPGVIYNAVKNIDNF